MTIYFQNKSTNTSQALEICLWFDDVINAHMKEEIVNSFPLSKDALYSVVFDAKIILFELPEDIDQEVHKPFLVVAEWLKTLSQKYPLGLIYSSGQLNFKNEFLSGEQFLKIQMAVEELYQRKINSQLHTTVNTIATQCLGSYFVNLSNQDKTLMRRNLLQFLTILCQHDEIYIEKLFVNKQKENTISRNYPELLNENGRALYMVLKDLKLKEQEELIDTLDIYSRFIFFATYGEEILLLKDNIFSYLKDLASKMPKEKLPIIGLYISNIALNFFHRKSIKKTSTETEVKKDLEVAKELMQYALTFPNVTPLVKFRAKNILKGQ